MKPFSKLRDLLEKSTPGEWATDKSGKDFDTWQAFIKCKGKYLYAPTTELVGYSDREFIAEAHNQLPRVLEALDLAVGRLEHILSEGYGNDFDKKALDKIRKLSND